MYSRCIIPQQRSLNIGGLIACPGPLSLAPFSSMESKGCCLNVVACRRSLCHLQSGHAGKAQVIYFLARLVDFMAIGTKWLCAVVRLCNGVCLMPTLEMQNPGDITHEETGQDRIDEKILEGLDNGVKR